MDPTLYKATMGGESDVLKQYDTDQLKVQLTRSNNTVLHIAAQFGQTNCVAGILQKCGRSLLCSVNIKGETSLHISAREGHTDIVQALIDYGKTLDIDLESGIRATIEMLRVMNGDGDTALYEAVRNNHVDMVEILTKEDPDFLHFSNNAKETPLYLAAERSYSDIVSIILKNCNSPAYIGPNGRTALHAATICYDQECITKLYNWKASLSKEVDVYGWRPIHCAAWLGHLLAVRQLLNLDKSMAYLVTDKDDNVTALHIAASQGHVHIMKELLSHCPDCWDMINNKGQNMLHIAAEHEKENVIEFILANSFASSLINQKDIHENTPSHLFAASLYASIEYSSLYRHPRVDKRAYNNKNMTPLQVQQEEINPNLQKKLQMVGCRNKFQLKYTKKKGGGVAEVANTNLIVATPIATVTFAAAFTVPGGYYGNDGPKQGMAVLMRCAAFKAFVVTDTIAMLFSLSAVFLHLLAALYWDDSEDWVYKRDRRYEGAILLIWAAMGAMVIALMTGLYAVLPHSSGLAITVCINLCIHLT